MTEFSQRTGSLRRVLVSGATWTAVGFGASQVLRLISSIILTRLIQPAVYGIMDLVMTCVVGLHLFSDVGLTPCVIQSPHGEEPKFLNTAWTIQVIRGAILAFAAAVIAYPVATVYGRPILAGLLMASGLSAFIDGLDSPGIFLLTRRLERSRLVLLETITAFVTLIATVAIVNSMRGGHLLEALRGHGPGPSANETLAWAVVGGALAGRLVYLGLSHLLLPGRARFTLDRESAKEILGFGKWIFLSTILAYLAMQTDKLLVPKFTNFSTSGLYGRAGSLLSVGTGIMGALTGQVVYPVYSRLHREGREARQYYSQIHIGIGVAGATIITALIAGGPSAAQFLYPADYHSVGWILQLLAISAWFQLLQSAVGPLLLATGRRRAFVVPTITKVIGLIALVAPCWYLGNKLGIGGFVGMIIGFIAADFVMYLSVTAIASYHRMPTWHLDLGLSALIAGIAFVANRGGTAIQRVLSGGVPTNRFGWLLRLACEGVLVLALWGAVAVVLWRKGILRLKMGDAQSGTPMAATATETAPASEPFSA
jgi:O-antigen/teichoic acid export membrane protein